MKDEEDDLTCTGHGVFVGVSRYFLLLRYGLLVPWVDIRGRKEACM